MLTRKKIEEMYEVDERREFIVSPGKFEGEPVFVPYFWDKMINGMQDDIIYEDPRYGYATVSVFKVTDEDRKEFPELLDDGETEEIRIWSLESGFACHERILSMEATKKAMEKFARIVGGRNGKD